MTCSRCFGLFLALALFTPTLAAAQAIGTATISGTVTDSTGAVLPGVTVEASSPALIEGTRTVTTNESGRYSIVNLRPGVYAVRFSLADFGTMRRDGIELTSDFTANINAQLSVSTVQETVTVTAATPVVDMQGVGTPRVLSREVMDALPTGRTPDALMATLPGVTPGFFGSQFRGTQDSLTMVDGMRATLMIGAGPSLTTAPTSGSMYEEFSFSTAIDSAEMGQPGMRINLVPRDGGNQFRGSVFANFTQGNWQTSNLDAELKGQGLNDPAKTLNLVDFNPTFGGPLVRNKLWFQSTFQYGDSDTQVLNTYWDADPNPYAYTPDLSRPGVNEATNKNFAQRLSWQVTPKDKVAGFYSWTDGNTPYFFSALFGPAPPPDATAHLRTPDNQQAGGRWTRAHTQRVLLEASFLKAKTRILNNYRDAAEPWSGVYSDEGLPTARPDRYAILDIGTGRQIGLAPVSDGNVSNSAELRAAATYVTGTHSMRAGFSFFRGSYHRPTAVVGHAVLRYLNGSPNSVDRTLPGNEREEIDGDWGFFVQDRWTLDRLTVNAGLRFDWLYSSVPDQVLPASPWLAEQRFTSQDVLDYKDLSPRVGAAYDLFGNGKTAVKFALARFVAGETVALTGAANPIRLVVSTDRRQWVDLNRDNTIYNPDMSVQEAELGPSNNLNFGTSVAGTAYDPNALNGWFARAYSWETNVSVQHELMSRVGVTALFYRRSQGNQRTNDNVLLAPTDFDGPFCITAPSDPRLPDGGGYPVCGLYDIKPTAFGRSSLFNTFATNVGTGQGFKDVVSGYEFTVNARLPRGAFLQGGLNFQRIYTNAQRGGGLGGPVFNACDVIDNPEVRFCENQSPFRPDFSITGAYVLPFEVQVSGVYQGFAGPNIQATWSAPSALIAPSLGRPLAAGPTATKTIALIEPNKDYMAMRHVFDLRFTRPFRVQRYRFQVMADLYNAFNDNGVSVINTTYGRNPFTGQDQFLVPSAVTGPRQFRLSFQADF